jgi:hypothetical protein
MTINHEVEGEQKQHQIEAYSRGSKQQSKQYIKPDSKGDKKVEPNNPHVKVKTVDAAVKSNIQVETLDDVKVESADAMVECQEEGRGVESVVDVMVECHEEGGGTPENKDSYSIIKKVETVIQVKTVDDIKHRVESDDAMVEGQEEGGAENKDWSKLKVWELKVELRARNLTLSGRKADLISCLNSSDLEHPKLEKREAASKPTSQLCQLTSLELLELQKLEEHLHEINECILNLKEYRGHLARHVSEDTYAQSKIDNLADDVAIVTSDYKMKILSCFFRETQKKWFGKRGTNLLGFMITTNALDEADKLQGVKDVEFVFMVTDDCLTDAWEVACAKTTLYEEFLPDHVKRVRFWSDGAGCFKSKTHRVFQPFWKHWTGVDEIELRITPAGNGKSQLDGRFGRLNFVLQGAVDEGHSYYDAPTILNAVQHSTGLTATKVRTFLPDRSNQVTGDIENVRFESVLLTLLDPNQHGKDSTTVRAFHHSGYGQGQQLNLSERSIFYDAVSGESPDDAQDESKSKKKEKKRVWLDVYNIDVSILFGQLQVHASATCLTLDFSGSIPGNN